MIEYYFPKTIEEVGNKLIKSSVDSIMFRYKIEEVVEQVKFAPEQVEVQLKLFPELSMDTILDVKISNKKKWKDFLLTI
jgi:hypothetical protein